MIEARHLSFEVGQTQILHDISVTAHSGEILGILGPNGAGKSTLLKCLAGFQQPTQGSIKLSGRDLRAYSLSELSRLRAVLTQQVAINFPFKVHEIVAMGCANLTKIAANHHYNIIKTVLELTQTVHLKDRLISTLSGGEQQRVHLARVLAQLWDNENAILFLDEPTSALDLKHQFMLFDICRELAEQKNYTIVVVLHDLQLAHQVCDRVLLLQNGKPFNQGVTAATLTPEIISSLYDVDPARIRL